jgi:hypothetical protein
MKSKDTTAAEGQHVLGPNAFPSNATDPIGTYNLQYISPATIPKKQLDDYIKRITPSDQNFALWVFNSVCTTNPDLLSLSFGDLTKQLQDTLPAGHELNGYRKSHGNMNQILKQEKFLCYFAIVENMVKLAGPSELMAVHRAGKLPLEDVKKADGLRHSIAEKNAKLGITSPVP